MLSICHGHPYVLIPYMYLYMYLKMCNILMHTLLVLVTIYSLNIARVTSVNSRSLSMMDKRAHKEISVPYGICVWSTGVAPQPVTKTIMDRIPYQRNG